MSAEYSRKENEKFRDYVDRLITNRKNYDLDNAEVYNLILGKQVSSDHARKCLAFENELIDICENDIVITDNESLENELDKKSSLEISNDGSHKSDKLIIMSNEQSKDVDFLLKAHGYDISEWELISARSNIWNTNNKSRGIETLYSSRIVVKPRTDFVWTEEKAKKVFESLGSAKSNHIQSQPEQYKDNGNVLVIPIADLHYGLYADVFSTGNSYDLDIAEELYYHTLNDIISRISNREFQKVLFIVGNDFINADNLNGTTTKGTPQDNSSLWFDTVDRATQLLRNGIDMLSKIAPVDVQYVTSNHDLHTTFGIMQTLKAWYRNDININIDDSPMPRKYYRIGKTLLALSHDIKIKDALKIISTEAKSEWSNSEHIICMLAHLHQAMVYEKQGYLEIMRLPTISGYSRWSNTMGYVQTEKKNKSFIINEELGITDELNTIIL